MSEWNTNMDETPPETAVLVAYPDGSMDVTWVGISYSSNAIAWRLLPEPPRPAKPEQWTTKGVESWPLSMFETIEMVEERTREICAWEQEYGE